MESPSQIARLSIVELQKLSGSDVVSALQTLVEPFKDISFFDSVREHSARALLIYLLQVRSRLTDIENGQVQQCFEIMRTRVSNTRIASNINDNKQDIHKRAENIIDNKDSNGKTNAHASLSIAEDDINVHPADDKPDIHNDDVSAPTLTVAENVAFLRQNYQLNSLQVDALTSALESLPGKDMPALQNALRMLIANVNIPLDAARFLITAYRIAWDLDMPFEGLHEESDIESDDAFEKYLHTKNPDGLPARKKRRKR